MTLEQVVTSAVSAEGFEFSGTESRPIRARLAQGLAPSLRAKQPLPRIMRSQTRIRGRDFDPCEGVLHPFN